METADPVELLTFLAWAMVILFAGTFLWVARDDILRFVKGITARYVRVQRIDDGARLYAMSSAALDAAAEMDRLEAELREAYQVRPDSSVPGDEPVRPERMTDDDIIDWLAHLKKPGESAYRFSANSIAVLVGGTRNEVLKKIAVHRPPVETVRVIPSREHRDGALVEREIVM